MCWQALFWKSILTLQKVSMPQQRRGSGDSGDTGDGLFGPPVMLKIYKIFQKSTWILISWELSDLRWVTFIKSKASHTLTASGNRCERRERTDMLWRRLSEILESNTIMLSQFQIDVTSFIVWPAPCMLTGQPCWSSLLLFPVRLFWKVHRMCYTKNCHCLCAEGNKWRWQV